MTEPGVRRDRFDADEVTRWITEHAHRLDLLDAAAPLRDLEPLDSIVDQGVVVGLARPTHGFGPAGEVAGGGTGSGSMTPSTWWSSSMGPVSLTPHRDHEEHDAKHCGERILEEPEHDLVGA